MSQSELARQAEITPQSVQAIESGRVQKSAYVSRFAEILAVRAAWLADGKGSPTTVTLPIYGLSEDKIEYDAKPIETERAAPEGDLIPVLAAARGGNPLEPFLEDGPVDYVPRPSTLRGVRKAYAMVITGTSMVPIYNPGQIVHINPFKRPTSGRGIVIWKKNRSVLVKQLVRLTPKIIDVREFTPEIRIFEIEMKEIIEIHLIVSMEEPA